MALRSNTIEKVKLSRRIKHDKLDPEINDLIDTCLIDLQITAGVEFPSEDDPMILTAIKLYCSASLSYDSKESEYFLERYNRQKAVLQVSQRYGGAE